MNLGLAVRQQGIVAGSGVVIPPPPTLDEAEWLMRHVDKGGAIAETPGDSNIRPYMSLYAALGLVKAYEVTHNIAYLDAAWGFAAWYRDHMRSGTGYVGDFTVTYDGSGNPTYTDTMAEDSTDAYAGMYLTLLWSLHQADNGHDLTAYSASIPLALTAIESTQQIDGLTYALPTYDVKYLEDNVEALYGARCAQSLAYLLASGNTADTLYVRAKHTADELARGVGILWNWETGVWDYAIHSNGVYALNDWTDENSQRQQIWATGWGEVVTPLAGAQVLNAYVAALPTWATQSSSGVYEVMPTWAYRRAGDLGNATSGAGIIEANGVANNRNYPWTCQTSGLMLIGQYGFTQGMDGIGADGNPIPDVIFPSGTQLLANSDFTDTNADGLPDGISNYGGPTNSTLALTNGQKAYRMEVPYPNGYDMHWDATYDIHTTPGHWFCFSVYKQFIQRHASDGSSRIILKWEIHDTSDNFITYGYNLYPDLDLDGQFHRIWISFLVPEDQTTPWAKLHLAIAIEGGGIVLLAGPKFEQAGAAPTPMAQGAPRLTSPAIVFPDMPFTDPFTRADGLVGMPWITPNDLAANWHVFGNAASPDPDTNYPAVINTGSADMTVSGTIKVLPTAYTWLSLIARCADVDTYYELQMFGDYDGTILFRVLVHSGGTADVIWSEARPDPGGSDEAVGDVVSLAVYGQTLTVSRNSSVVASFNDTTITAGNYAGMQGNKATGTVAIGFVEWDSITISKVPPAVLISATRESDTYGVNDGWLYNIPSGTWHIGVHYQTPDTALHDFAAITVTGPATSASGTGLGEVTSGLSGTVLSLWLSPTSNYADRVSEILF